MNEIYQVFRVKAVACKSFELQTWTIIYSSCFMLPAALNVNLFINNMFLNDFWVKFR